jgi:hypothetical protein
MTDIAIVSTAHKDREAGEGLAAQLRAGLSGAAPDALGAGFNSYGQIVRAEGQFSGFHNCTAVVCVFPD